MKKVSGLTTLVALCLFGFYSAIIFYVLFAIVKINTLQNFVCGIVFQVIALGVLLFLIITQIIGTKRVKIGFFVPIIVFTLVYLVVVYALNIFFILNASNAMFTLMHLILLFIYCLVSIPMYVMGKNSIDDTRGEQYE